MTRDKQKARTAIMVKNLCIDVVSSLDDSDSWAAAASDTGRVTPVQFLAVVLWAVSSLQRRDLSDGEVNELISQWWKKLVEATAMRCATLGGEGAFRHLYPLDALTLLELDQNKVSTSQGWCLNADDVDKWLSSHGFGCWCAVFFDVCGVRRQDDVVPLSVVSQEDKLPTTWAELKRYHAANPGHAWTQPMRGIVANEERRCIDLGHSGVRKRMAADLGMSAQAIGEHIRTWKDEGTKSGRGRSKAL